MVELEIAPVMFLQFLGVMNFENCRLLVVHVLPIQRISNISSRKCGKIHVKFSLLSQGLARKNNIFPGKLVKKIIN